MGQIHGDILFAGHKPSQAFLRRYTGYVEQFGDDPVPGTFPVSLDSRDVNICEAGQALGMCCAKDIWYYLLIMLQKPLTGSQKQAEPSF